MGGRKKEEKKVIFTVHAARFHEEMGGVFDLCGYILYDNNINTARNGKNKRKYTYF